MRNWMDARLDFPGPVPLRKSYVVASSYRCGSTFFCSELWRTGVLGAPAEYLNIGRGRMLRDVMLERLQAVSPDDYFVRLLSCRTSRNGVFGLKAHIHHFEAALDWCPSMLRRLSPVTYLYLNRRDRLAQAISMAKALQTDVWTSMDERPASLLHYDEALIRRCLLELRLQRQRWWRWFERNDIAPIVVHYEDLIVDPVTVVRGILEAFDVQADATERIHPTSLEKLGDDTNRSWADRFRQDDPTLPPERLGDGAGHAFED